jgi:hypothetical protein
MVAMTPIGSLPGMIRRASAPAINPMIIHQMKFSMDCPPFDALYITQSKR